MNTRKPYPLHPLRYARGSSLMEVLITVLVMAIGLMGVAQMQISGVRNQSDAFQRSIAIQQVNDMMERMRANTPAVASYVTANAAGTNPGCITAGCTAQQVAQFDVYTWVTDNGQLLPSAVSTVTAADASGRHTISLAWTRRDGSNDQVTMTWSP